MPDTVTMQLDAVAALAGQLTELGAELVTDGETIRADGTRLGQALSGPAAEELAVAGVGWGQLVAALADRAQSVAAALDQAVQSYRALDGLLTERVGAGLHAATAR